MKIKNAFDGSRLFDRLPTSASIGLALAAITALATLFQGITTLLSVPGFYSNFFYGTNSDIINLSQRLGLFVIIWATLQLIAIYFATGPRPIARLIVVSLAGVNSLGFITWSLTSNNISLWTYVYMSILIIFTAAPILLLLSRRSNQYYR